MNYVRARQFIIVSRSLESRDLFQYSQYWARCVPRGSLICIVHGLDRQLDTIFDYYILRLLLSYDARLHDCSGIRMQGCMKGDFLV